MPDERKDQDPLYGVPAKQDPLYGEGGTTDDVPDPEAVKREGKERAEESGEKAKHSSGGGGQEGI